LLLLAGSAGNDSLPATAKGNSKTEHATAKQARKPGGVIWLPNLTTSALVFIVSGRHEGQGAWKWGGAPGLGRVVREPGSTHRDK